MIAAPPLLHSEWLVESERDAAPLILLHGFTGDLTTWSRLLPHLGSGRPVLAIELTGHGASPAPGDARDYAIEVVAAAAAGTAEVKGISRAHWLGYSMGSRVALRLALDRPDLCASLVLVGASPGIDDPALRAARVRDDQELAAFIEREGLEAFVDRWSAHPLFATQSELGEAYLAAARAQRLRNRPHALANTLRSMGTGAMPSMWGRLGEIRAPVLLVAGEEDPKFCGLAADMAAHMLGARTLTVPRAGHAVHVEAPAALGRAVTAFLSDVEAV